MAKKKDALEYLKEEMWPKTKEELGKGIKEAKRMLNQSEKYLKTVSEKGIKQTKKISLVLKKEKLYYNLGKAVARTKPESWPGNKKIETILKQIKSLDGQVAKIK